MSTSYSNFLIGLGILCISVSAGVPTDEQSVELTDENWDQIQKGQWLIAFFDKDTPQSLELAKDWELFSLQVREQNIKSGRIFGPKNPGLDVRFLVSIFPQVFYVKNGVAYEIPKVNRAKLVDLIKEKQWNQLKAVGFLVNPFSVQMSLLSRLFIHAVALYNYEDEVVQKIVPFASATDIAFGLTFVIIGTAFGLLVTCCCDAMRMFFMSKYSDDDEDDVHDSSQDKEEEKEEESTEDSAAVRKRK